MPVGAEAAARGVVAGIAYERTGTGEPILLIHGTGGSRASWEPVTELLAPSREVILIDLPGHGESELPPAGVAPTATGYPQLIEPLLDELGLASVAMVGNSIGAWTALELAKRGRARSVVAIAPAGLWGARGPLRSLSQLWVQHRLGGALAPALRVSLRTRAGRAAALGGTVGRPVAMPAEAAVRLTETFAATRGFDEHVLATRRAHFAGGRSIDVPVTVVWGKREWLLPRRARRLDELPAHTSVLELPRCGHVPMWDDPRGLVEVILRASA